MHQYISRPPQHTRQTTTGHLPFALTITVGLLVGGCAAKHKHPHPHVTATQIECDHRSAIPYGHDNPNVQVGLHRSQTPTVTPSTLRVVSFNIKFGGIKHFSHAPDLTKAIAALSTDKLRDPDILLLQEMDGVGVARIAAALQLNYVYYPASVHNHHCRDFGNAILTPWPVEQHRKRILDHVDPRSGNMRAAVMAVLRIGDIDVLAYSVHTEVARLCHSQKMRLATWSEIIEDIDEQQRLRPGSVAIVGGDFNTALPFEVGKLKARFNKHGFAYASSKARKTFEFKRVDLRTLDFIFVRDPVRNAENQSGQANTTRISPRDSGKSGKNTPSVGSDHFPIWAELDVSTDVRRVPDRRDRAPL